jgi:flavin-binding protein dodecin
MAVEKAIELIGTGPTLQEAVQEALDRAELTLRGITAFDVEHVGGTLENGRVEYRVRVVVWFALLESIHG